MRDVFAAAAGWQRKGRSFAVATLCGVRNAAPAPLGASMAVTDRGEIAGDIGAGCYESQIVEAAMLTARDGAVRVLEIDLSSDDPLEGSSGCGGFLEVAVWRPPAEFATVAEAIAAGAREVVYSLAFARGGKPDEFRLSVPARRTIAVVGGTALAQELASIAARVDFRTVVVDPRPAFATTERLRAVAEIVVAWPDEALPALLNATTPLVVISHDPKLDLPALRAGLASDAPYIGLLGSRRAQKARRAALRADGFDAAALARIHGPAGLDLGGESMAETAVSIVAEIIAAGRARSGSPLLQLAGAIHNDVIAEAR